MRLSMNFLYSGLFHIKAKILFIRLGFFFALIVTFVLPSEQRGTVDYEDPIKIFNEIDQALKNQSPLSINNQQIVSILKKINEFGFSNSSVADALQHPRIHLDFSVKAAKNFGEWFNAAGTVGSENVGLELDIKNFKVKWEAGNRSIGAAFSLGFKTIGSIKIEYVINAEFKYRNNYDFISALGIDTKSIPGARTILQVMDRVIKVQRQSSPISPENTLGVSLEEIKRQILPQMLEGITRFETLTLGQGWALSSRTPSATPGVSEIEVEYMNMERLQPGQQKDQGIRYNDISIEFSRGIKIGGAEADLGGHITYSTDPDNKPDPLQSEASLAIRQGLINQVADRAIHKLLPVLKPAEINRTLEQVRLEWTTDSPKGIRIYVDDGMLAQAIRTGTPEENAHLLFDLCQRMNQARDNQERHSVLAAFVGSLKSQFKLGNQVREISDLSAISLRSILERAEKYIQRWEELPQDVRNLGGLTRIYGYVIDQYRNDIWLLGNGEPDAPPISIDDMIVGVRAVWKEGGVPTCSIDLDPNNPMGPQQARISGVPADSCFAHDMLEADYIAKKILFGIEKANVHGYKSEAEICANRIRAGLSAPEGYNRFWFYPVQPGPGNIQVSKDKNTVMFVSAIQLLTERMVKSAHALIGTGTTSCEADEASASFTRYYKDLAKYQPALRRLQGLFDIVFLCRLWRHLNIDSNLLGRLSNLPYNTMNVPKSFPVIKAAYYKTQETQYSLCGGVIASVGISPRSILVLEDGEMVALKQRVQAIHPSAIMAFPITGVSIKMQDPSMEKRDGGNILKISALGKLLSRQMDIAYKLATEAIHIDPYDAETYFIRAIVNLNKDSLESASSDAHRCLELDPDNPNFINVSLLIDSHNDLLNGNATSAVQKIDKMLQTSPNNVEFHLLRAKALSFLGKVDEERDEYLRAIALDPSSPLAYSDLAELEARESRFVEAVVLAKKAYSLAQARNEDIANAKITIDMITFAMAEHLPEAQGMDILQKLKQEVLADLETIRSDQADNMPMIKAYLILAGIAIYQSDWKRFDEYIQRILDLEPKNPMVLIYLAEIAYRIERSDLAIKCLERAIRLAPDHPKVKELGQKIKQETACRFFTAISENIKNMAGFHCLFPGSIKYSQILTNKGNQKNNNIFFGIAFFEYLSLQEAVREMKINI